MHEDKLESGKSMHEVTSEIEEQLHEIKSESEKSLHETESDSNEQNRKNRTKFGAMTALAAKSSCFFLCGNAEVW